MKILVTSFTVKKIVFTTFLANENSVYIIILGQCNYWLQSLLANENIIYIILAQRCYFCDYI